MDKTTQNPLNKYDKLEIFMTNTTNNLEESIALKHQKVTDNSIRVAATRSSSKVKRAANWFVS